MNEEKSKLVNGNNAHNENNLKEYALNLDLEEQHAISHGEVKKASDFKTFGNIIISFVGAGVLGLPYAFKRSGLLVGMAFLAIVAALALRCMFLLVNCKRALSDKGVISYSEVALHTLGPKGQKLVETLLVVSQTGFCVAYLVFISQNLASFTGVDDAVWVVLIVPFQLMLGMIRGVAALAPFSLVADFANLIGIVVVLWDDVEQFKNHEHVNVSTSIRNLPFLFGVVIYCYEGIGMILPIEESMANRKHFDAILAAGIGVITSVFVLFGCVGYLAFGEKTEDIITLNLPQDWTTNAVISSLCIGLFFTFPIMMIPVYEIVERGLLGQEWFDRNVAPSRRWMVFKLIRTTAVILISIVAISVPAFGIFIALIGSLCCSLLAFVIPSACHLSLFGNELELVPYAIDWFMIVFGCVGAIFGVGDSIQGILKGEIHVAAK
eukprot:TRINITY_DN22838_c0_g2_i2.p1 TRINITY_DN22838_c0_g2~~TRINITY_DN22838_c0_g2_i2.p1  ORF type:complete len:437 (+),score=36.36 TRINITY_DN22838_c0_g2_i2:160-1470(+)